tara:strand:- start:481 stop:822 length:342 start_codon:yes stop_codon:yes gene_type:complete
MSTENGKYDVEIGGEVFHFVANYACIKAIEDGLGKGIIGFFSVDLTSMSVTIEQMVTLYHASMTSQKDSRKTREEIGVMIAKDGLMTHINRSIGYVSFIVNSGTIEGDEAKKQ